MARAKKKQAEQEVAFEDILEPLANWIEAVGNDLDNIVETVNGHANAGNQISDRVDQLTVKAEANRVLLQGCREDLKRERQIVQFLRERVSRLEESVYAQEPTLWERLKDYFRGES